jgi:hypothetical protein
MDDWITTAEAAEISRYHVEYIRQLARDGKFIAQKWARDWMISRASFLEYLQRVASLGERRGRKPQKRDS